MCRARRREGVRGKAPDRMLSGGVCEGGAIANPFGDDTMTFAPEHFTVWMELPVTDMDRAITFYNKVLNIDLKKDDSGPNPMAMFPTSTPGGIAGHLYPGKPAADGSGATVHLACPDKLEDALARVNDAGGKVVSEPIAIPAGRFAYCLDTEGNSIGIFSR